jgi:hypothetical protein
MSSESVPMAKGHINTADRADTESKGNNDMGSIIAATLSRRVVDAKTCWDALAPRAGRLRAHRSTVAVSSGFPPPVAGGAISGHPLRLWDPSQT